MKRFKFFGFCFVVCLCLASCRRGDLVIVYTNDTHSQVEVCGGKNAGLGGYVQRAGVIDSLRTLYPDMLLFDAGDFSQGSPYFNLYRGRVEVQGYNQMGYDVVTFGNHEFDNGLDTLAARLREARFDVVCCNYDVRGTVLEGLVKRAVVIKRGGWKVGVLGLGVSPESLISAVNFGGIRYLDPIVEANACADSLKRECGCDVVVALSHLGSEYEDGGVPSDVLLAEQSRSIDVILGGHTHQLVKKRCANLNGDSVLLLQNGKSGAYLSKVVIGDERN